MAAKQDLSQVNLTGKRVRIRGIVPTAIVTGGFGCNPQARGSAIFVKYDDGRMSRFNRSDVAEVVEDSVPQAT